MKFSANNNINSFFNLNIFKLKNINKIINY